MIHSVDSEKLAKAIDDESAKKGFVTDILVEFNIGDILRINLEELFGFSNLCFFFSLCC